MADRIIAPLGSDAIEIGGIIDDDGQRFMLLRFNDGSGNPVTVSMLIPMFQAFAAHCAQAAKASATRDFWRDVPRF